MSQPSTIQPVPLVEEQHGTVRPAAVPLLLVLVIAVVFSAVLVRAEDAAGAAALREGRGLERGAILDRNGRPLVSTGNFAGEARAIYKAPDLPITVGYREPSGQWYGLEARYNGLLAATLAKHDWRTFFLHLRGEPARGGSVRTTIDKHLQAVASAALGNVRGAVVGIEPSSGAILAMVSRPACPVQDLSRARRYAACVRSPSRPLLNRATQLLVPPGSSFKIVTLSAALDTRRFTLSSIFGGADAWGPSPYFDNVAYPSNVTRSDLTQLTLAQALAFSDNFAFAHVGLTLGASTLLRYAHRYYVGRRIPFIYPIARSVIADGNLRPGLSLVAQSSFGAAVDRVTPMQMALIAATVANNGTMMAPHLVSAIQTAGDQIAWRWRDHVLSRVMSQRAAHQVTTGMEFVVQHGSGYRAQINGIAVAGKTGTAASGADQPHAWFITFAPASHPIIAVAVLHEFSGEGFKYAAPIARKVLVAALQERGYRVR